MARSAALLQRLRAQLTLLTSLLTSLYGSLTVAQLTPQLTTQLTIASPQLTLGSAKRLASARAIPWDLISAGATHPFGRSFVRRLKIATS